MQNGKVPINGVFSSSSFFSFVLTFLPEGAQLRLNSDFLNGALSNKTLGFHPPKACVNLAQTRGARTPLSVSGNSIERKSRTLPYKIGYYYLIIIQNQKDKG